MFTCRMKLPLVVQSPSESDAVATSFVECIQYLIKVNIKDQDFCELLLEQHVSHFNLIIICKIIFNNTV